MGCGNSVPKTDSATGPAVAGGEHDHAKRRDAEKQAAIAAYTAATGWLANQACPVTGADSDCTMMHATLTVADPNTATWKNNEWQGTCGWTGTVDCEKERSQPKVKRKHRKVLGPDKLSNMTAGAIDLSCSEDFYHEGEATDSGLGPDCKAAGNKAVENARKAARIAAQTEGGGFKCTAGCPSCVSELWIGNPVLDPSEEPIGEFCKKTAKCAYAVQVYCA